MSEDGRVAEIDRELSGHRVIVRRPMDLGQLWTVTVDGETHSLMGIHWGRLGGLSVTTDRGKYTTGTADV
jgi:hypothetical protein